MKRVREREGAHPVGHSPPSHPAGQVGEVCIGEPAERFLKNLRLWCFVYFFDSLNIVSKETSLFG